jgi:thiol-disulfide isomerase/thioredoxin
MKIFLLLTIVFFASDAAIAQNQRFESIRFRTFENIISHPAHIQKVTRSIKPILKEKTITCTSESLVYYDREDVTDSALLYISTTCSGELVGCDLSTLITIDSNRKIISEDTNSATSQAEDYRSVMMPPMVDSAITGLLRSTNDRSYIITNEYVDAKGKLITTYSKKLNNIILIDSIKLIFTIDTNLLLPVAFSSVNFGANDSGMEVFTADYITLLPNAKNIQQAILDSIDVLRKSKDYTPDTTTFTFPRIDFSSLVGKKFPDLELMDTAYNVIKLSDIKKKYIVVDLWYITCAPCLMNISTLNQFHKNFKDSADVALIGVDPYNKYNIANVKKVFKRFNITYPSYVTDQESIEDLDINSFPTLLILDKELTILKRVAAPYPGPAIRELLAKKGN